MKDTLGGKQKQLTEGENDSGHAEFAMPMVLFSLLLALGLS